MSDYLDKAAEDLTQETTKNMPGAIFRIEVVRGDVVSNLKAVIKQNQQGTTSPQSVQQEIGRAWRSMPPPRPPISYQIEA